MAIRNNKPKSQRLSPKMRIFADHLAAGHSQREAGIAANYSENRGHLSNLSRHPAVVAHIEHVNRNRNITQRLTLDWWVSSVLELATRAKIDGDRTSELGALRLAASYLHVDGRADSPVEDSFVAWLSKAASKTARVVDLEDSIESKAIVSGTMEKISPPSNQ